MARKKRGYRISLFSEFSILSVFVIGLMVLFAILSLALTVWMAIPPPKEARLEDEAGIFTEEESQRLLRKMKSILREKEINVMVVTVSDKGSDYYEKDEQESIRYAQDRYMELSHFEKFRDNSGVLILLELDEDYRFFYVVTFGTAKSSVTNAECRRIFLSQKDHMEEGRYFDAIKNSLNQVKSHDFISLLLILTYASFIVLPIAITIISIRFVILKKRGKKTADDIDTYLDRNSLTNLKRTDNFIRTVVAESVEVRPLGVALLLLRIFAGGLGGSGRGGRGGGGGGGRFGGGGGRF